MHRVGARLTGRAPTGLPQDSYFWPGMLLILGFGMTLAGIDESFRAGDWLWFTVFVHLEVITCGLYFWVVRCWLAWIDHSGDA